MVMSCLDGFCFRHNVYEKTGSVKPLCNGYETDGLLFQITICWPGSELNYKHRGFNPMVGDASLGAGLLE